jgi:D-serine dehydratase
MAVRGMVTLSFDGWDMTDLRSPIDETIRGIPPGSGSVSLETVASQAWRPADNSMPLPVLTLDEAAFRENCRQMFAFARSHGAALAPHAKTPMSPDIVKLLLEQGAWGATTANLQQTAVLLKAGCQRLLLANQIGGDASGRRLGELLKQYPDADVWVFADSPRAVSALAVAGQYAGRPVPVLIEVGRGRAGARDIDAAREVIHSIASAPDYVRFAGVAAYEGAVASADPVATRKAIEDLSELAAQTFHLAREQAPAAPLVLSAGGSAFFDLVVTALQPIVVADGNATLVLRSGAIFFHDHGVYERALRAMDDRKGFVIDGEIRSAAAAFTPALRLWAEVLSRPEPDLAICGMGMRDVSSDQDLPVPLNIYRNGRLLPVGSADPLLVSKLNDQHAFLTIPPGTDLAVGDVVEFGISHPCTCLDRWRIFYGLDEGGRVRSAFQTYFG